MVFFTLATESEPEPPDTAAQVLWTVLCAVRGQKHPCGRDEQHPASSGENAPEIRPQRLNLQTPGIQEGKRKVQPYVQGPGLHARHARGPDVGCRHLQRFGEDVAARLSGKEGAPQRQGKEPLWLSSMRKSNPRLRTLLIC